MESSLPRKPVLPQFVVGILAVLFFPNVSFAAGGTPLDVPLWSMTPFVLMLLCIAVLPLVAEHFWHSNRNKAIVAALLALPVAGYLLARHSATHGESTHALLAEVEDYFSFVVLLGSLYVVSGGILVSGTIPARPANNVAILGIGAVLANLIGTTGASMLLIRPMLRMNRQRSNNRHIPVFFIIIVSNIGGLLTPLGDPPLFLGFLEGVPFTWTLRMWPHWLLVNGTVLVIFRVWDGIAFRKELASTAGAGTVEPIRVTGAVNFLMLGGILLAVLMQSPQFGLPITLVRPWGELVMVGMVALSLALTPRSLRKENGFTWGPIIEVAVVFAGIFVTMVPALHILRGRGPDLGLNELRPWQYFTLTGGLSAFLDNAPTYLAFATMAASPRDLAWLAADRDHVIVLQAISCGAVFMGALTYIGNGPNFMVKAIADEAGYKTPSFFAYLGYSLLILGPILLLTTALFFL
jgi:Na+/H+ antiporter NhaD/arsenite permease-like protein